MLKKLNYKQAGVDIDSAGVFKSRIKGLVKRSFGPQVLKNIGGFGGFYAFSPLGLKDPVLVSSADGVGTKIKVAILVDKHDTVGIDAVAMNVNDILCTGAKPLFFLDYIAFSKLPQNTLLMLMKGLTDGCVESGCALVGGETAQMPGMYKPLEYDLAGFCVGVVDKNKIIDGAHIRPTDQIIGLESNGIHSNGYSLVRKVFSPAELRRMSKELLKPTRIYVKQVLALLEEFNKKVDPVVTGIAHITGGAFYDKISRVLPYGTAARIHKSSWNAPQIFKLIQAKGKISDTDMYHTLNMGIGMALMVRKGSEADIIARLAQLKVKAYHIGEVLNGQKDVKIV